MNFDGILNTIKGFFKPKFELPMPTIGVNEKLGGGLSPQRQSQLDSENKAFLTKWNSRSDVQPSPAPASARVLGASVQPQTEQVQGGDLWSRFSQAARSGASARGYDANAVIKQKALESNFGRSNFATERNNFGGIGAYDSNPNQAFNFKDIEDYLDYYFKMVEKRYPKAYENRANPQKYIEGLKEGGYATDPDYVWKIMNTPLNPR